jgi:CAAX protease family protein
LIHSWIRQALGVIIAIAITTVMDTRGLSTFSAIPLLPLMALFWHLERFSRADVGFVWGRLRNYGVALLHPVIVLGLAVLMALIAGAVNLESTVWHKAWLNLALVTLSTVLIATVTEEGFFRGWLWASLYHSGHKKPWIVVWTSISFAAWHLPDVLLETGFNPPLAQVPIYIVNATLLGAVWGMLRLISGSVIVTSVVHGVWNGVAYVLFGFGAKVGALGIEQT